MPRDPFKPLTPQEQQFAFHWVREGCHVERMAIVERKAKVPKGKGAGILARPHVQREIDAKKSLVDMEQARLIARDQNRAAEKEDKQEQHLREVTLKVVESRLHDLLDLDAKTHGSLVLSAIQTSLVYTGVLRSKTMERTIPIKDPSGDPGGHAAQSVYSSIFSEMPAPGTAALLQYDQTPAPLNPSEAPLPKPPVPAPVPAPPAKPVPPVPPKRFEVEIS